MFITLIGTIAAGFMGAGFVLILRFLLKERVPKWAIPIAAGAFMLAATISSEYGWFPNASASLPEGVEVVATREAQAFWRPWTYVTPFVDSFMAMDRETVLINPENGDQRLVDLYLFTRWRATTQLQLAVDCAAGARAEPGEAVDLDDNGWPAGVIWRQVAEDDALLTAACG